MDEVRKAKVGAGQKDGQKKKIARVARRLQAQYAKGTSTEPKKWKEMAKEDRQLWLGMARVAVKAQKGQKGRKKRAGGGRKGGMDNDLG